MLAPGVKDLASCCPLTWQMADAMEMMILSILAPQLHCEWRLPSWQVALLTSVGNPALPVVVYSSGPLGVLWDVPPISCCQGHSRKEASPGGNTVTSAACSHPISCVLGS